MTSRCAFCRLCCVLALVLAALGMLACCSPVDSEASGSSGESSADDSASAETSPQPGSSDGAAQTPDGADDAPANGTAEATVENLTEHANRLWTARVDEDWQTVFEYQQLESDQVTAEDFAQWSQENEPFVIKSYEIKDVVVDDDMGWIVVEYESAIRQFPKSPPRVSERSEKWQIVDGQWKLIPADKVDLHPASPALRDLEQEQRLIERFKQSWAARAAEDWDALYAMTDPRDRADVSLDEYAEAKALTEFIDHEIEWVEVIDDAGTVRVAITHKLNDPNLQKLPPTTLVMSEQWVLVDGVWYMDLDDSGGAE